MHRNSSVSKKIHIDSASLSSQNVALVLLRYPQRKNCIMLVVSLSTEINQGGRDLSSVVYRFTRIRWGVTEDVTT